MPSTFRRAARSVTTHSELQVIDVAATEQSRGVQVVFQCGFQGCRSFFIGYYPFVPGTELKGVKPTRSLPPKFPAAISELSPTFVAVYTEAQEAAHLGLSQIAGPGYRKAFEFLIKDYAKSLAQGKEEDIKRAFVGTVVNEFLPDPRIQAVAKRTLWLGNDETHYLRKWEAHDITDLVTLIQLTVNWIEIEKLSLGYIDAMPDKNPGPSS